MEWFETLSKRHEEYLRIVQSFPENQNNDNVEDIVQDAYIEVFELGNKSCKEGDKRVNKEYKDLPVCEKILNNNGDGEVNMFFMWIILKRVSMSHLKQRRKEAVYIQRLGEGFEKANEENEIDEKAFNNLMKNIEDEINKWHWYDKMLFQTYIKENKSMRVLSKDTLISLTSIFTTIRNCKNRIKQNVGEDYTDYLNKDYELIK